MLADKTPEEEVEEEENAEELCNTNFSLAYGSKILLNKTQLKLMRGYRYGLVGQVFNPFRFLPIMAALLLSARYSPTTFWY